MDIKEFQRMGLKVRRKKAEKRLNRVRDLRKQKKGLSGPKILEILNADGSNWKLRTIYEDIKKLKAEQEKTK